MLMHGRLAELVAQQGWNDQSLVCMLSGFVEDEGLEDKFLAHAQEVADVENLPPAAVRDGELAAMFTCHECGKHKLVEVCVGSIVYSEITSVTKEDDNVVVNYASAVAAESGTPTQYQCGDCGQRLPIDPCDDALFAYLFPGS